MATVTGKKQARQRRGLRVALAEMYHTLRTEGESPWRKAVSVWLGVVIGVTPLYGTHLVLSAFLSRMMGVSRVRTYLAAHINNPLTAPAIIYIEYGLGSAVLTGKWPSLPWSAVEVPGFLEVGGSVLLGSLILGPVLGVFLGLLSLALSARSQHAELTRKLRHRTAHHYLSTGLFNWEFVRGKLRHDPVYMALLGEWPVADGGRVVDLGCGRGIALALLDTAGTLYRRGDWPTHEPPPPTGLSLFGVEKQPAMADVARKALQDRAVVSEGDLAAHPLEPADVYLLLDVLHYLDTVSQDRLLERASRLLRPGGVLLIRGPDSDLGWRFRLTAWSEWLCAVARGHGAQQFTFRGTAELCESLRSHGLNVKQTPMWRGTPFANVLIEARRVDG